MGDMDNHTLTLGHSDLQNVGEFWILWQAHDLPDNSNQDAFSGQGLYQGKYESSLMFKLAKNVKTLNNLCME